MTRLHVALVVAPVIACAAAMWFGDRRARRLAGEPLGWSYLP